MSIHDAETLGVPLFVVLKNSDPDVVEAVREARRTLPQFLDAASKMQFSPAIYLVKVPFIDRSETGEKALARNSENAAENPTRPICHLWLTVTSVSDDLIFCWVQEAPDSLHLERGTSFVIASDLIEDWMINQDGTAFGGFSLRVIRSHLPEEEQINFDAYTGIREFKTLRLDL
jgi:uncharacterized protein YegJ (DUF2314 family)